MMSNNASPAKHARSFPWTCVACRAKEVFPQAIDYTTTVNHDGHLYSIHIPDLLIPTCRKCGDQTFAVGDDDRIHGALRAHLDLLSPEEIQDRRGQLHLTQHDLAEQLGVSTDMIVRWESGAVQSRALDNLMRVFFASEDVRQILRERRVTRAPAPINRPQASQASTT